MDFCPSVGRSNLYYLGALLGISTAVFHGIINVSITLCIEVHSLVLLWWSGIGTLSCALFTVTFYSGSKIMHLLVVVRNGKFRFSVRFGLCISVFGSVRVLH